MTNGLPPAPPRVENPEHYWSQPPPEPSARCAWWHERISLGWKGNTRILKMGYYDAAWYFGVYIWEWLHVLRPMLL